jgi:ribulose-bisphosphate carboxylase large chain
VTSVGAPSASGPARRDFTARYLVESYESLEKAAEIIAGEQSSGTFVALPGETAELKERARARVVGIEALENVSEPSLDSAFAARKGAQGPYHRGIVEVSFPIDNVGPNLPNLYATVAGNLFELGELTGLRVLDLDLPEDYAAAFPGPQFGIEGTRERAGVHGRPVVGTIIKPSIGLSAGETAALVDTLCAADIDFIKDDELMGDPPYAPLEARVRAVMAVVERHADRVGRKVMVAFNISDDADAMLRHHDFVVRHGGTCVMASVNWTGPAALTKLRRHSAVPIHGLRLRSVPEALATRRSRPASRQRAPKQILGTRRQRHPVGQGMPQAVCRNAAYHAGLLIRAVGRTGARHLCGARQH